ncbi:MAG TPA: molybdate ABC transporter substrate-binding protein [Acidobacteriaceae bacterium]
MSLRDHSIRWLSALLVAAVLFLMLQKPTASSAQQQTPLRVAAAADLEPLLPGLLTAYQKQSGQRVEASFASSATLATQIENGAPFDIFLSADMMLPQRIVHDGFAAPGATAQPYARGTLVLWTRNQSGLKLLNLDQLGSPEVHSIAIANPQHAPYGRAAMQALKNLGLLPAIQAKLRTAENIAQAAQFASTGNADVGLISLTSALALTAQGHYVAVPQSAYQPILQGAVALKGGSNQKGAAAFLKYLHSPAVAQRLQEGGLTPAR